MLKNENPNGKANNLLKPLTLKFLYTFVFISLITTSNISAQNILTEPEVKILADDIYNAQQIIENNKNALVSIFYYVEDFYSYYSYTPTSKDTTLLNGSGFIVAPEGIIGTNYHVVESLDSIIVKTSDGTFYDAELMMVDEKNDFAILKLKNTYGRVFQTVKMGDSDSLKVGQDVFAIGSPLGFEYTISQGIIAAIRPEERVEFTDPNTYALVQKVFDKVIQITAAISPGNSGGALFTDKGEVVGITTYSYGFYGNLNFASAINSFKKLLNTVLNAGPDNPEFLVKKEENLFNINYRLGSNYKNKVVNNWFYSKQADTMKVKIDTFIVRQDSLNKNNLIKAENYLLKSIELRPDSFYVYKDMIDLYVVTSNYQKAETLYTQIRERFDNDSLLNTLSYALADAYTTTKDYKRALTFYEKLLKKDTTDNYIRFQIGETYKAMKDYKGAIKIYNDLIRRDSNYTRAYSEIGIIYYKHLDNKELAKKYFNAAYERDIVSGYSSSDAAALYYIGMIAIEEGREMDAMLAYLELKNMYTYTTEETQMKLDLYRALKKMMD